MTEEVQNLAEVAPAPAPEVTATPPAVENAPEVTADGENSEQPASKVFTQEELDAAIGKRLAREQRKWEREQQARLRETQLLQTMPQGAPSRDQYDSDEAYADALATVKAEQLVAQRRQQEEYRKTLAVYEESEEKARDKYDDFDQVTRNPNLPITNVMLEAIQSSDIGPDVAYYLGTNPKEAERIANLSPYLQAKEIGKIEVKIASNPPVKKTSSAPAPISPVTARGVTPPVYDTTDPRSTKTMSDSQWIEAERQRQIKKWEAQRNR
jgi:hypothetical protein